MSHTDMSVDNPVFESDDINEKVDYIDVQKEDFHKTAIAESNRPNVHPVGRYKWAVLLAAFMHFVLFQGVSLTFGLIFVELSENFQIGKRDTAWIISINFAGIFFIGPFASVLCQWFGYWTVALLGTLLACVGLLSSMAASNIKTLYITYGFLGGIGNGMIYHVSVVCVVMTFNNRKSLANGICICGTGLGMSLISPLAEWCIHAYGWRGTLLIETGLLLNGVPIGLVFRRVGHLFNDKRSETISVPSAPTKTITKPGLQLGEKRMGDDGVSVISYDYHIWSRQVDSPIDGHVHVQPSYMSRDCGMIKNYIIRFFLETCGFSLLDSPEFAVYSVSSLLTLYAVYMPFIFIPDLAKSKGIEGTHGAWLLSASGITSTVCKLGFGLVADQAWVNRFTLQGTSLVLSGLFTAFMPVCDTFILLLVDITLFSSFQGYIPAMMSILTGDLTGHEKLSQGFGLVCWFGGFGSLIGPPLTGWFYDISGNYSASFWTNGLVLVTAGILVLVTSFIHSRKKAKNARDCA